MFRLHWPSSDDWHLLLEQKWQRLPPGQGKPAISPPSPPKSLPAPYLHISHSLLFVETQGSGVSDPGVTAPQALSVLGRPRHRAPPVGFPLLATQTLSGHPQSSVVFFAHVSGSCGAGSWVAWGVVCVHARPPLGGVSSWSQDLLPHQNRSPRWSGSERKMN